MLNVARHADIAVIELDNPPVNALDHAVRSSLLDAVATAEKDQAIAAILIYGAGRHFVAGADIRELDQSPREPLLNDVLLRLEACSKPVIAAAHGSALGGGLELMLACHYRLASASASLGLPEIRLGLIPGSGGTQRLPRLIGAGSALGMMLSGDVISGDMAATLGIVDRLVDSSEILNEALAYVRELLELRRGPRRLCELPGPAPLDAETLVKLRGSADKKFPGITSIDAIVESVQAASSMEFLCGLALSRRLFEECRRSTASRSLRHLFSAERGTSRAKNLRSVSRIGILGAGTMGSGIAISLATAGYLVTLVDTQAAALTTGLERVRSTINASVEKRRLTAADAAAAIGRVTGAESIEAFANAEFVIEAVVEKLSVKQEVFFELSRICPPTAVLASNTSTLDIDAIAAATDRPQDVVGMHFFSPANVMRLVEVVRGEWTAPDVVATTLNVSRTMGKLGVVVGNCFGFVGNRMLYAYGRENQLLLLEGATPTQVDAVLEKFGMAMGPNAVGDLSGLDVGYHVRRGRHDLPADPRYYRVADLLVESGRLGQKTGAGVFSYVSGSRKPTRDTVVEEMIEAESQRLDIRRRPVSDVEIHDRCLMALINEGAACLHEGVAASPYDIDAIWCNGYGFPRYRGGPMFYADTLGPAFVVEKIQRFALDHGYTYWTPSRLLLDIAASGDTFQSWHEHRAHLQEESQ